MSSPSTSTGQGTIPMAVNVGHAEQMTGGILHYAINRDNSSAGAAGVATQYGSMPIDPELLGRTQAPVPGGSAMQGAIRYIAIPMFGQADHNSTVTVSGGTISYCLTNQIDGTSVTGNVQFQLSYVDPHDYTTQMMSNLSMNQGPAVYGNGHPATHQTPPTFAQSSAIVNNLDQRSAFTTPSGSMGPYDGRSPLSALADAANSAFSSTSGVPAPTVSPGAHGMNSPLPPIAVAAPPITSTTSAVATTRRGRRSRLNPRSRRRNGAVASRIWDSRRPDWGQRSMTVTVAELQRFRLGWEDPQGLQGDAKVFIRCTSRERSAIYQLRGKPEPRYTGQFTPQELIDGSNRLEATLKRRGYRFPGDL